MQISGISNLFFTMAFDPGKGLVLMPPIHLTHTVSRKPMRSLEKQQEQTCLQWSGTVSWHHGRPSCYPGRPSLHHGRLAFVLEMPGFVREMHGFVVEMIGFVLEIPGFVLKMTGFVLEMPGSIPAYFDHGIYTPLSECTYVCRSTDPRKNLKCKISPPILEIVL